MTDAVKRTRRYDSPHRREQADSTRRHILDTARRLFVADGYSATSIAAIARESGVVSKTVYLAFESKGGLLRALWQLTLSGEDDQAPVVAREWYQEMISEPDPGRQLALNARNSRAVKERAGAMMAVISSAAAADPDARALWDLIESNFHENQATVVASLAGRSALRPGLAPEQATDILWTINHPDIWRLLCGGRGWAPAAYEDWTAQAACSQLLGTPL